jgi:hypothetical protein
MKNSKIARRRRIVRLALVGLAALSLVVGCDLNKSTEETSTYKDYLYMSDTKGGKIYTYDPTTYTGSSSSLVSTGQNATGEIAFYKGIGYAAVGYGTGEGVYYFDPSATSPSCAKISGTVAAQYFAFYSATKAYVSTYGAGIYSFDPSSPASGLSEDPVSGTSGLSMQDMIIVGGYLYAADTGNGAVLRIDPSDDSVDATITTTQGGTTGLVAGTYNSVAGVFVANTGGSIDFIEEGAASGAATAVVTTSTADPIYPGRLIQLANGNLVATGYDTSYDNHTYLVTLSGTSATVAEIMDPDGASPFGSLDIAYKDSLVYIPMGVTTDYTNYTNKLYVLDATGKQVSYSPVTVMSGSTTVGISNIAFYEE